SERTAGQGVKCAASRFDVVRVWHRAGEGVTQTWSRWTLRCRSNLANFGADLRRLADGFFETGDDLGWDAAPDCVVVRVFEHFRLRRDKRVEQLAGFVRGSLAFAGCSDRRRLFFGI